MNKPAKNETIDKEYGYIFLHRKIRNHWLWKDTKKFQWWIDILMECNHSEHKITIGFQIYECKRGQSLNSLQTWAKRWRVDVSTVRRFLGLLESDTMIVTESLQKTTLLTVCKYDDYNSPQQAKQFQSNGNAMATQSQRNTNNNEIRMNKNEKNISPDGVPPSNPPKEEKVYTDEEKIAFVKFQNWIIANAADISKMDNPFTIEQYLKIKKSHSVAVIADMLTRMANYKPLLKKNKGAYTTFLNWSKKDFNKTGAAGSGAGKVGGIAAEIYKAREIDHSVKN